MLPLSCEGNLGLACHLCTAPGQALPDSPKPPGHTTRSLFHHLGGPGRPLTTFQLRGTLYNLSSTMQTGIHQTQNPRNPSFQSQPPLTTAVILTPSPGEETASWCQLTGPPGSQALLGMGPGPGKGLCESVGCFVACSSNPSGPLSGDFTVTLLGVLTRGREQGNWGDLFLTVPWQQRQDSTNLLE